MQAAPPGQVVCLAAGSFDRLDLKGIVKSDYVTLRGAPGHATTLDGVEVDSSAYIAIEGFRFTDPIAANRQTVTHHIRIVGNEIGPAQSGIVNTPAWGNAGHHSWVVERNFFHDIDCPSWPSDCPSVGGGYAIAARGNAPSWTVRYNRFERVLEDMMQSGQPDGWVVDHNWFGPGDFNRPAGYTGHADMWQILDPGENIQFTNNVVRDTNQHLGFIFGDHGPSLPAFQNIRVENNLFKNSAQGETCQFSPTIGFVFTRNTLVNARGCRWGSGEGDGWPDAQNYSITNNLLSGNSRLSCNNTSQTNSCNAFNAGLAGNVTGWNQWADTTWYIPTGQPAGIGARLSAADFPGFPFGTPEAAPAPAPAPAPVAPSQPSGGPKLPGIGRARVSRYARTMVRQRTKGRVRRLRKGCSGSGTPLVTCFLKWRIGRFRYRGDALFRHVVKNGKLDWDYRLGGTRRKAGCKRCRPKRIHW